MVRFVEANPIFTVSDLIDGSRTNGSDERMYAEQWFNRCWFSFMPDYTFLKYLIEWGEVDNVIEMWESLEDYKHLEELDEYDKEEMECLENELNETFKQYQESRSKPEDSTLESGMEKVLEWDKERQMILAGPTMEKVKER